VRKALLGQAGRGPSRLPAGKGSNKDYGIVIADLYKNCLKARGWNRAQQFEPAPAGWFRGIEEDGPMRLEASPSPRL